MPMLGKNKKMNQNATETLDQLKKFVAQQASDDASLPAGEKRHQARVVREVLSDQVTSSKTLKRLIDEYMAGRTLARQRSKVGQKKKTPDLAFS